MTSRVILRVIAASAVLSLSTPSLQAQASKNAFFCQGKPGKGWAYAAIREIPDGDVQFAIHKWREDGKFFGVCGIAQRSENVWIYKERDQKLYLDDDLIGYKTDLKPNEFPTCKVSITLDHFKILRFEIDTVASCDSHAGYGFFNKSTEFGPDDFDGAVRGELDDHDKFNTGTRCDEPKNRKAR